jgi:phospholipase C
MGSIKRSAGVALLAVAATALAGCEGASPRLPLPPLSPSVAREEVRTAAVPWAGKIQHVVIIFQENRSFDNMFNGYPGADTQAWGLDHLGARVRLTRISETVPYDISHTHAAWQTEYDHGKLDGWDLEVSTPCGTPHTCPPADRRAYGMLPRKETQPYWAMAREWTLADRMFQTNEGPSFPAHQYIISGTSTVSNGSKLRAAENPLTPGGLLTGGCDAPRGSLVRLINERGNEDRQTYPCFERRTLMDLLDGAHVTWRYYVHSYKPGLWNAPDAIKRIRDNPDYLTEVRAPSSRILADVHSGDLASVTWVTPDADDSDHARVSNGSGPSWVASVVNTIGESTYWNDTVILLTWDDWGGWYDHVRPPRYNTYELGFRVPLLVISPYAKKRYVSHRQHEFGSILKFIEETYGLRSLGTTDVRADNLADCFDFNHGPRKFARIRVRFGPAYFLNKPPSNDVPDDDF